MLKKQGIIFDCDGTLVNSLGNAMASFNFALEKMGEELRPPEMIKKYFGTGADRIFQQLLQNSANAMLAFEYYLEHQGVLALKTELHVGVRELLDLLKREGVPMAVVTGRHSRDLEVLLKPLSLDDYFITLIADDHLQKSKPAPEGIILAARRMGLGVGETYYVGDSAGDVEAAHAAGSVPIAALWDEFAIERELNQARPAFVARKPGDVWEFFKTGAKL